MRIYILVFLSLLSMPCFAKGTYQQPNEFIAAAFDKAPPTPKMLWITRDLKPTVEKILQHKSNTLRIRYWLKEHKSAWILEEIGKEQPITVGIIVDDNKIALLRVLIFRETRGSEVRHAFFYNQFSGAKLSPNTQELDQNIDGISGATLSVRALTKLARLALFFHQQVTTPHASIP